MKLQVNTSGAWKNVLDFDAAQRNAVKAVLPALNAAIGGRAKWCLVADDGERIWLNVDDVKPLPRIDFTQGHLNGYVPGAPNECYCFNIVKGKYCGAAKRWPGHGTLHEFVAEQVAP
jgi:hypothetical protein